MRSLPFLLVASTVFGLGVSLFIAKQTDPMFRVSPGASLKAADLSTGHADPAADEQALVMLRRLQRDPKRTASEELTLAEVEWLAADQRQRELDAQATEAATAADEMPESENDEFADAATAPNEAVIALADQLQESGQVNSQDITTTMALAEDAGVDPEELTQELVERDALSNDPTAPAAQPAGPAAENAASVESIPEAAITAPAQPATPTNGL